MAQEIDLEKCNFRNFRSSVALTLTLDRVEVTPMLRICDRDKPTDQIRTDTPEFSKSIRTSPGVLAMT